MAADTLRRLVRLLWPHLRVHRATVVLLVLLGLMGSVVPLANPLLLGRLVDGLFAGGSGDLASWVALAAGLSLATVVIQAAARIASGWLSGKVLMAMRQDLLARILALPYSFFATARVGDLLNRLNGDLLEIERAGTGLFLQAGTAAVTLVFTLGASLWLEWRLTLLGLAVLPATVWIVRRHGPRLRALTRDLEGLNASASSILVETLEGVRLFKAYGIEAQAVAHFGSVYERLFQTSHTLQRRLVWAADLPRVVLALGGILALGLGGTWALRSGLSPGTLAAVLAYQMRALTLIHGLATVDASLQRVRVALERVMELDAPGEDEPAGSTVASGGGIPSVRPHAAFPSRRTASSPFDIELVDVSFAYEPGRPVLQSVSVRIPHGRFVAIIGASGAGKSTLADLLLGLQSPQEGAVYLGGQPLVPELLPWWRGHVALVEQAPILVAGSLRTNVTLGRPEASPQEVDRAIERAQLRPWVESLPDGLQTPVGERGVRLSAGQRQRIAVARALLRDPQVIILDEPTASVDEGMEEALVEACLTAMRGRTILLITHRLALARRADEVLALGPEPAGGTLAPRPSVAAAWGSRGA